MGANPKHEKGQSGILQAALFGLCPKCGARTLFEAPAMVAGECSHCHEPLAELELGGRIAGLITMIVAGALIIAALGVDELLRPPLWVHVIVWAPLTIGAVLFTLRLYKTIGVYRGYERKRTAYAPREPQ